MVPPVLPITISRTLTLSPAFTAASGVAAGISVAVEIGHDGGKGDQQKASGSQSRVHKVLPQAAEQHLHNENCKYAADDADPPGHAHRQVQRQQKSCHHSGQIPDGILLFRYLFI